MEASSVPRGGGFALPRSRRLLVAFNDARLVEEVRRGNDAAFEVIYDRHHRGILVFARHMLASREEAEDALQHVFAQAYDSMRRNDRELHVKAWLYTIARNRCLSILRARREQPGELDEVPTPGLSEAVQQRSDLRELLRDIRDLPDAQRAALVLSELGDLSHAGIAEVLGCETKNVKSLVFQARSALLESRAARETPCQEIREQLATLRGGALRRGVLRRHVRACPGCGDFREQVRRQRTMLAAALPVIPSVGLKGSALGALGLGAGGGGLGAAGGGLASAGGGAAAGGGAMTGGGAAAGGVVGGGLGSTLGAASVAKLVAAVAAAGVALGGGAALTHRIGHHAPATHASKTHPEHLHRPLHGFARGAQARRAAAIRAVPAANGQLGAHAGLRHRVRARHTKLHGWQRTVVGRPVAYPRSPTALPTVPPSPPAALPRPLNDNVRTDHRHHGSRRAQRGR